MFAAAPAAAVAVAVAVVVTAEVLGRMDGRMTGLGLCTAAAAAEERGATTVFGRGT